MTKKIFYTISLLFSSLITLQALTSTPFDWDKIEAEDRAFQKEWVTQQSGFTGFDSTVDPALVIGALDKLGLDEKPLAKDSRSYIKYPDGSVVFSSYKETPDSLKVKEYGLGATKVSYVAEDDKDHRETFTPTLPKGKTYKHGRKHPFPAFSLTVKGVLIDFDAGHGIDQADTIVANGRNSSTDPHNFVPQNRYYNQKIRNHIVNHEVRKQPFGSYKEISIYDDTDPLICTFPNGKKGSIPIGFIFVIFSNHQVARTFYFPNLISYEKLMTEHKITPNYRSWMDYFEISKQTAVNDLITIGDTDKHTQAVSRHATRGYRALSGRFDIVRHIKIPNPAKAALRRLVAIYDIELAAHLEYRGIEHKAALVNTFTSMTKYYGLDKATIEEDKKRTEAYFQVYKDEEKILNASSKEAPIDLMDYALDMGTFLSRLNNKLPADDPREAALKRVQARHDKLERGQPLYYPERAKKWLQRIESTVVRSPNIEDIICLLDLYDIPEVRNEIKKKEFEDLLEKQGLKARLFDQKSIGDYFYSQLSNEDRSLERSLLEKKMTAWKKRVEKGIYKSISVQEITEAAEWYHGGRGMFEPNISKAQELYLKLLPYVDKNEQNRITYCLNDLEKRKKYSKKY